MSATENKEISLSTLLTDAFDGNPAGLRQWIRLSLGKKIHDELPNDPVGLGNLAFEATLAIQRHGRADTTLFESLHEERPGLSSRIADVARLYGVSQHSSINVAKHSPARATRDPQAVHGSHVETAVSIESLRASPRVFISYSHEPSDNALRVLELANQLRADGIDAWIDQYEPAPPQGWPRWMQQQIEQAEFILMVCTTAYRRRFEDREGASTGKGITWEGLLAQQVLYDEQTRNPQLLPVLFDGESPQFVPLVLRPFVYYQIPSGYEALYRRLTGQPATIPPPVGELRRMPIFDMSLNGGAKRQITADIHSAVEPLPAKSPDFLDMLEGVRPNTAHAPSHAMASEPPPTVPRLPHARFDGTGSQDHSMQDRASSDRNTRASDIRNAPPFQSTTRTHAGARRRRGRPSMVASLEEPMEIAANNLLGVGRAEADTKMLDSAFLPTAEYRALTTAKDFHFVVGRRGTGKSALYRKVGEYFGNSSSVLLLKETPKEYEMVELVHLLTELSSDYSQARTITRLIFRSYILQRVGHLFTKNYKAAKYDGYQWLDDYLKDKEIPQGASLGEHGVKLLGKATSLTFGQIPRLLAETTKVEELQQYVANGLARTGLSAIVLFDGLDEGWKPQPIPTAIVGGLAIASTNLAETESHIHTIMFARDNMFRALAYFDPDFSRNIEGVDLRLKWNETSLLSLVASRLRIALADRKEQDLAVWNRFAHRGLKGKEGFSYCLRSTLYRPRDLIALLNRAYMNAAAQNRGQIVDDDVDKAAREISKERLDDLHKEYKDVLPGLPDFIGIFYGAPVIWKFADLMSFLQKALASAEYSPVAAQDFAIFSTPEDVFHALYSVGFLGLDRGDGKYEFCHDGATSTVKNIDPNQMTAIHPCYWRAMGADPALSTADIAVEINDEYKPGGTDEIKDLRLKQLGSVLNDLNVIPCGSDDARRFEDWVYRAVQICFQGPLKNFQKHPTPDAIQRRDIVATNVAEKGFWKRVYDDYKSRQIVFEVKNYEELKPDDYRQCLAYGGNGGYGKFSVIVYRSNNEGADDNERSQIKVIFDQHEHLILLLPAPFLRRLVAKQRNAARHDYAEDALDKRLDTHVRSYLRLHAGKRSRKQRKRKK